MLNKVALVTGGAQGIGLAISAALLKSGAKVSLLDVRDDLGLAACKQLQMEHTQDRVIFIRCDVTNKDQLFCPCVCRFVAVYWSTTVLYQITWAWEVCICENGRHVGGLDIVCNNAGIADEKNWRKMVDINLVAVIEGTYLGVEFMSTNKGHRGGDVINIASMGGLVPMSFSPAYCASKHGVVGFTRSMKEVLASDGVRVNAICPDFVNTAMVRQNTGDISSESRELIADMGLISPEVVAEGLLQLLLQDKSKVGAALMVRPPGKLSYFIFVGEQRRERAKL
eukprot:Em0013g805a